MTGQRQVMPRKMERTESGGASNGRDTCVPVCASNSPPHTPATLGQPSEVANDLANGAAYHRTRPMPDDHAMANDGTTVADHHQGLLDLCAAVGHDCRRVGEL